MYWLLDVAVLVLLLIVISAALRRGVLGILVGVGSFILRFLYTILFTGLFVFICQITGLIDALTLPMTKAIADSTIYDSAMVANFLAAAILAVIGLLFAIFTLFIIVKTASAAYRKKSRPAGFINRTLGLIIGVVLYVGGLYAIFGVVHAFVNAGAFPATDELLRACPVTNLLYNKNILTKIVYDTGLPKMIINALSGNFNELF